MTDALPWSCETMKDVPYSEGTSGAVSVKAPRKHYACPNPPNRKLTALFLASFHVCLNLAISKYRAISRNFLRMYL